MHVEAIRDQKCEQKMACIPCNFSHSEGRDIVIAMVSTRTHLEPNKGVGGILLVLTGQSTCVRITSRWPRFRWVAIDKDRAEVSAAPPPTASVPSRVGLKFGNNIGSHLYVARIA